MMISNGKYANGGMLINPFAALNDGLIDVTWINDPNWQGSFGVTGIMSDARKGGRQAYRGHSQYLRGRKIRIDIPEPQPVIDELDFTPDGEGPRELEIEGALEEETVERTLDSTVQEEVKNSATEGEENKTDEGTT